MAEHNYDLPILVTVRFRGTIEIHPSQGLLEDGGYDEIHEEIAGKSPEEVALAMVNHDLDDDFDAVVEALNILTADAEIT